MTKTDAENAARVLLPKIRAIADATSGLIDSDDDYHPTSERLWLVRLEHAARDLLAVVKEQL